MATKPSSDPPPDLDIRERLLFAQIVYEIGAKDWARVSSTLTKHPLITRPKSFFSPAACETIYETLMNDNGIKLDADALKIIQEPKARPNLYLAQMFYKQRFNEIKELLLEEEERFRQNAKDIAEIEAGEWDERIALDLGVGTPSKPPMSPMIPALPNTETPKSPDKPIALQVQTQPITESKSTLLTEPYASDIAQSHQVEELLVAPETTNSVEPTTLPPQDAVIETLPAPPLPSEAPVTTEPARVETMDVDTSYDDGDPPSEAAAIESELLQADSSSSHIIDHQPEEPPTVNNHPEEDPDADRLPQPGIDSFGDSDPIPVHLLASGSAQEHEPAFLEPERGSRKPDSKGSIEGGSSKRVVSASLAAKRKAPVNVETRDKKRPRTLSDAVAEPEDAPSITGIRRGRASAATDKRFQAVISLLHDQICSQREATVFAEPVTEAVAPDYHEMIKEPMDLATIRKRIKLGTITTTSDYERAINLMFCNAFMYNLPGSETFKVAHDMMQKTEILIQNHRNTESFRS